MTNKKNMKYYGDSTVVGPVKPSPGAPASHLGVVSWPDLLLMSPENSEDGPSTRGPALCWRPGISS